MYYTTLRDDKEKETVKWYLLYFGANIVPRGVITMSTASVHVVYSQSPFQQGYIVVTRQLNCVVVCPE